jgi:pilus assembly protein Flp/PilA
VACKVTDSVNNPPSSACSKALSNLTHKPEKEITMNAIKNFLQDEEGSVAIEYALLAALIGLAIVLGASFLGKQICGILNSIGTALAGATPTGGVTYKFAACA